MADAERAPGAGRVALVTGATGGIGLATVQRLLGDTSVSRVVATSRSAERDASLAGLVGTTGDRLLRVAIDVTDEAAVAEAAAQIRTAAPRLHLLINTVGALHDASGLRPEKRLADLDGGSLARSFALNAIGPMLVVKHLAPLLLHGDRAVVINLSARVGSIGDNQLGGWYGYRASKAALNQLTRTAALELRRRSPGIICVAFHPGTVDTPLSRPFSRNVAPGRLFPPERAAAQLLALAERLGPADNGAFFAYDGSRIPW